MVALPHSPLPSEMDDAQTRLLRQMAVVNRISSALSLTIDPDEINLLMLAALVSRQGLGYCRAMLLTYDENRMCFEGRLALGPLDDDEVERFEREVLDEEEAVDSLGRMSEPSGLIGAPPVEETAARVIGLLRVSSVWKSVYESWAGASALCARVRDVLWPYPQQRPEPDDLLYGPVSSGLARRVDRRNKPGRLPAPLDEILDEVFDVIPVFTRRGKRIVVLADRRFNRRQRPGEDFGLLTWFHNHATLALENAEHFRRLNDALEELKALDRLKSSFLSMISHELRTPLAAMLGFCEIVLSGRAGALTTRQSEVLKRALYRGALLKDMINDLLEIAELESGGLINVEMEEVDPVTAFRNIHERYESRRAAKDVAIETHVADGTPRYIRCNQKALERILWHLVDNAIKFTPRDGRVDVTFECKGGHYYIHVSDTGIGISAEDINRIFTPFFQVDDRLARRHEGIGIGLTVTKRLVSALNGTISVDSLPGGGSTFTVAFPIRYESQEVEAAC